MQEDERDRARAALHALLGGYRSLRESGEDAQTAVEVLLAVLREFPVWAIEEACLRIAQNRVDTKPPLDPRWAPSNTQIYQIVAEMVRHFRARLVSATALLTAPVEEPVAVHPERSQVESALGRTIGDRPQRDVHDEIDGQHANRVAADIAARKARNATAA